MDKKREPISKKDLLEWRLMNLDYSEVTDKYSWSTSALRTAELVHGVLLPKKKPRAKVKLRKKPHPRLDELKSLIAKELCCNQIAEIMNLSYDTVCNMAKHNGLKFSTSINDSPPTFGRASLMFGVSDDVKAIITGKWR